MARCRVGMGSLWSVGHAIDGPRTDDCDFELRGQGACRAEIMKGQNRLAEGSARLRSGLMRMMMMMMEESDMTGEDRNLVQMYMVVGVGESSRAPQGLSCRLWWLIGRRGSKSRTVGSPAHYTTGR